jgi:hypothetical protein
MSRVLVLLASTADPAAAIAASLSGRDLAEAFPGDTITLVSATTPPGDLDGVAEIVALDRQAPPRGERILTVLGLRSLHRRLSRFPAGRLLNTLGPADTSRSFWRAMRADEQAMTAAASADIVVAGDLASTRAAWMLWRRSKDILPISGLRAAASWRAREAGADRAT